MAKSLTIGDLLYKLGFENEDQFVASMDKVLGRVEKDAKDSGKKAGRGFTDQFKATFSGAAIGSFLGTVLSQAFAAALQTTKRFVSDSVKEYAVYEQGLLQLKLAGESNLGALSQRIQEVAKATKVFSATDVSLAVGDLVKAGYDAETAFALVETGALGAASEVDAATLSFGDLGNTSVQLGNILRAMGYDISQSGRVMDVLAKAAQDSNLNVSDLVDIVSRVGPTAKLAGLDIEDLAAQAAVLSNSGMDATLIGTGLRSVFQSLINPSAQLKGQLDALGISIVDRNGNLRDFNDVLDGLHELTERGGEGLQILTQATGSYGSTAASALGTASEAVKEFRGNMDDAEGSAKRLADTTRDSAAGAMAEMQARTADAKIALGEQLTPVVMDLYETVFPALVTMLGKLIDKWEDWQFIITGTTASIKEMNDSFNQQFPEEAQPLLERMQKLDEQLSLQKSIVQRYRDLGVSESNRNFKRELDTLNELQAEHNDLFRQVMNIVSRPTRGGAGTSGGRAESAETTGGVNLPEEYRNLADIQAELTAAQDAFTRAQSKAQEDAAAASIKILQAELDAKKQLIAGAEADQAKASAEAAKADPLIEQANRIAADLPRLKLAYEQGKLTLDNYLNSSEGSLKAHLRRLDGLYDKAGSPQQRLAVLRARQVYLTELDKLTKGEQDRVETIARIRDQELQQARVGSDKMIELNQKREEAIQRGFDQELAASQQSADAMLANQQQIAQQLQDERQREYDAALQGSQRMQQLNKERADAIASIRDGEVAKAYDSDAAMRRNQAAIAEQLQQIRDQELAQAREGSDKMIELNQKQADAIAAIRQQEADQAIDFYQKNTSDAAATAIVKEVVQTLKLAEAKKQLGLVTKQELVATLDEQIARLQQLASILPAESQAYIDLAAAIATATAERANYVAQPVQLTPPKTTAEITPEGKRFLQERQAFADSLQQIAMNFPKQLYAGIKSGDIAGALSDALGSAADFFVDSMIQGILGPIAENLAEAATNALLTQGAGGAAALGPAGLIVGGLALVASLFLGAGKQQRREATTRDAGVQRTVSTAPSITYNLTAELNVQPGASFGDPAWEAKLRNLVRQVATDLLQRAKAGA